MIDRATAERIKAAADIVEVVSDYVHLQRRGSNFMGLCPFHNERTPSFSVNRSRNICYCFSCHKGGSPVNFIMEKEGINYHDALLHLARKYGIPVEERKLTDEERALQSRRESMLVANEWAMMKMQADLTETEEGRDVGLQYFHERGVTPEALKAFRLGYALDSFEALTNAAKEAGYDIDVLRSVGLVGTSQQGKMYDRFRGRVIFPVFNTAGKVVAFGGRDLKGGPAKYINSPESEIYKKNRELYGIFQAKNEIVRQDKCFLVEGYMDVIGMWQSGMQNVIASSGTALTDGQIALIHRFTDKITLIYDGDAAGIKASLRGIDMLLSHKMQVKVLLLPDGHDPDSFARAHTPEEFREFVAQHETDIIRFKAQVLMQDAANDPLRRSQAIRSVVESLACIPDQITANVYVQECARLMDVEESLIARETSKARIARLERLRSERRYEEQRKQQFGEETDYSAPAAENPSQPEGENIGTQLPPSPTNSAVARRGEAKSNSLYPFERQLARYCIRYGMLPLTRYSEITDEESGEEYVPTVAEFIRDELNIDGLTFSDPTFAKILEEVLAMNPRFISDRDAFRAGREAHYEQMRREGIERIAAEQPDMQTIRRREAELEEAIKETALADLRAFAIDYTGRHLASHEDDNVRRVAIECLTDQQPLSRRFEKMGNNTSETERLYDLLPRALNELKQMYISRSISECLAKLRTLDASADEKEVNELLQQMKMYQSMQAQMAKAIGDRVVSPKR